MYMSSDKARPEFSKGLFWDVDTSQIDYDSWDKYVIERTVQRGLLKDWFELKNYYGLEKIQSVTMQTRYLDKYTLSFLSTTFSVPQEEFRCYKFRQLNQGLWPY